MCWNAFMSWEVSPSRSLITTTTPRGGMRSATSSKIGESSVSPPTSAASMKRSRLKSWPLLALAGRNSRTFVSNVVRPTPSCCPMNIEERPAARYLAYSNLESGRPSNGAASSPR